MSAFRRATSEDVVFVCRLVKRFYARSGNIYRIPYDHESALAAVYDTINTGICLVGPQSCAGAIFLPFPFNQSAIVAQVIFWYFEQRREIAIFDALLEECRANGATHVNVAAIGNGPGRRFYQARGLTMVETQYLGPLQNNSLQSNVEEVKAGPMIAEHANQETK
jgi:hypothetical protein